MTYLEDESAYNPFSTVEFLDDPDLPSTSIMVSRQTPNFHILKPQPSRERTKLNAGRPVDLEMSRVLGSGLGDGFGGGGVGSSEGWVEMERLGNA